jgi:hypothetical protein
MGWKASCILINERGPGYLGTKLSHDPKRAMVLIDHLGLGRCHSRAMTTFDEGIYPDHLVVGAYDGAAVIGDRKIIDAWSSLDNDPLMCRVRARFPQAAILRIALHGVVNLFGYEYFEDGKLLRAYSGCADTGVVTDVGELLPEEWPHFERSVVRDGERFFYADIDGQDAEFDAPAYGETLVFELMGRFFGCQPDRVHPEINPFGLPMESFDRVTPRWWPFQRVKLPEEGHKMTSTIPGCLLCGEKPGGAALNPDALCPSCVPMLDFVITALFVGTWIVLSIFSFVVFYLGKDTALRRK